MQEGAARRVQQLGDSKGSVLMLVVAFIWALTSSFDKMGMAASPSVAAYLAVQRAMTAVPAAAYLLVRKISAFSCATSPPPRPPRPPRLARLLIRSVSTR